jgi:hypothetical protein
MDPFKEKKTKRINIRITPSDHEWLFEFAKENELTVSKLFERFVSVLRKDADQREDAHSEVEVS